MAGDFDEAVSGLLSVLFEYEWRAGYAGVELDRRSDRVYLYWKGDVPEPVAAALPALSGAHCQVLVRPADHDRSTLRAARDRLMSASDARAAGITTVALPEDGSALRVGCTDTRAAEALLSRLALGVPAVVTVDAGPTIT